MLTVTQPHLLAQNSDLPELLQEWQRALALRVAAGELAGNTLTAYRRGADRFLTWCTCAGVRIVDGDTLRSWKADLLERGYKPAAVNAWLAGARAFFAWALAANRLPYNPAEAVVGATRKGEGRRHSRDVLTDVEVRRVLALPDPGTPAGRRDLAILALMVYTGVRTVEVHRADLDQLKTESGRLVLYVTGKGHTSADDLVVVASDRAGAALYDWLAVRGGQPGPLFTSLSNRSRGERLGLRALRGLVKGYFQAAGLVGNKTAHSLRHTAITKAILGGATPLQTKHMARHESLDTTMIYVHEVDRLAHPAEAFITYGEDEDGLRQPQKSP